MRQTRITGWSAVKVLLTVTLIIFCAGVWPGYLFHTYQTVDSYPNNVAQTQWLSVGDTVQQHFSPVYSRSFKIRMALDFDESVVDDEYLRFTLLDDTGANIYDKEIYFNQISSDFYFDIEVRQKLDTQREYVWTLTMPEDTRLQYAVLCVDDVNTNIPENKALLINDKSTQNKSLNEYNYYAHYDKPTIIGDFWIGAFLVWSLMLELTDRTENFLKRKKNDGEDRSSEEI